MVTVLLLTVIACAVPMKSAFLLELGDIQVLEEPSTVKEVQKVLAFYVSENGLSDTNVAVHTTTAFQQA